MAPAPNPPTSKLHDLLHEREHVLAATDLDTWAKTEAVPSEEEIRRMKDLIHRVRNHLDDLTADQRAEIEHAITVVRRTRQLIPLGMPRVHADAGLRLEPA